jgi:o-succinylbenzoate---CoA ligase
VSFRPLHAVLLPPAPGGGRLLAALSAALDGTGPAILPLDPGLPDARLRELLDVFAPSAIETPDGTKRIAPPPSPGTAARAGTGVEPDVAVVIATSGSTGRPKGVELTAAALRASAASSLARIGARPGQRWLCCLPGFHVAGIQVLVRSLLAGAGPVVSERIDARVIAGAGCAHVSLVPTQLRRLLDAGAPLDRFETILLGGAAPPAGLLADARAAGAPVVTTYGMSETCGGCVYDGLPLDGVRVQVGGDGLIRIAGPVLFARYRLGSMASDAERSGAAALDEGWFSTSDLGSLTADGRLIVRGRADDVINTGGEKVVPGEVEAVLGTIDGVRDVVVVGMPDQEWGELVTAFVVPADQAVPPDLHQLREHARGRLAAYAAPRRMLLVAEVPLLASGKPDRQALRTQALRAAGQPHSGSQHPEK